MKTIKSNYDEDDGEYVFIDLLRKVKAESGINKNYQASDVGDGDGEGCMDEMFQEE